MPRITADAKAPTSRAISRPGMIKARAVPRTIALAVVERAAEIAIPARRNVCLLSRFGRVVIVTGRVLVGGRVLTGGVVARVFVLYSVLTVALVDGNWSQLPNLEAVLAAGAVSSVTISSADCGRRAGSFCKRAATASSHNGSIGSPPTTSSSSRR